ncbi:urea ABC transporter permease subunit UrtB [Pandoraea nosoerga]|uniref:Urea ABC transporter permease subunit UrtB n=1 Tax=Pandoraea nosoerga TaxID=2508296 RepID=A0A5E4S6A0_9BURK|nr:urea ABC transporter permease subunit UrtB [Pandoraea nosoerga]MBN4667262.1 urea ABC transporter permease subunit UrtB [Pandoraea nosoerga]MBN4676609.1 urea ABC transporter permease subunit UrtB [Pandoraea nosoerga]MBN4682171.1 urea ABC transporter permease subunit UrtB [Pandoraea nosoerga]MBN4743460.1 urea ABC transporter permease subunit UrtB [Pandoraea nosoerga]VVD69589.1 urea ABC transporter permease subunit UrtB [Pandoraea nosoerga]
MITIRRWTAAALVLLSLGAALITPGTAAAAADPGAATAPAAPTVVTPVSITNADLAALAGDDFDAKAQAIDHLAADGSPQAAALLKALADDSAVAVGERIAIPDGDRYVDPITGATVKADDAGSLTLNNVLRAKVATAAAAGALLSPDRDARARAIDTMLQNPSPAFKSLVDKARAKETDPALKPRLDQLWAQTALHDADPAKRREAIDLIAAAGDPQMRDLLLPIVAKQADGTYAESDASVRGAADIALTKLASAQRRSEFFGTVFAGLSLGSVLLLAALGLAITYGLIGVINMAHGEFLMVGAYATYVVQTLFQRFLPGAFDWYLVAAVPAAFLVAAALGLVLERTVIKHLYGRPLETLLTTFGISLLLIQAVRTLFGAQNVEVVNPSWMSGGIAVLPNLMLPYNRIVILAFALVVVALTWSVLNLTRLGLFIRAVTQNRSMAACVGVKTGRVDSYAFAFGAGIAGLGGCALSQIGNVGPDLGQSYIIDSFMAVVLGGVGQLAGTIVGAFGLGIANKLLEPVWGAVLAKIAVLILIVLFIQKRPQGMFALKGRSAEA